MLYLLGIENLRLLTHNPKENNLCLRFIKGTEHELSLIDVTLSTRIKYCL